MFRFLILVLSAAALACTTRAVAQETLTLSNGNGAEIGFTNYGDGWHWTQLATPATPQGWSLFEGDMKFAAGEDSDAFVSRWQLVERTAERLVFERDAAGSGLGVRRIFSFGPAPHVVRIETWVRSLDAPKLLHRVALLTLFVEGETFQPMGAPPASFPVFGHSLFAGVEDLCAESRGEDDQVRLWQTPDVSVGSEWQFIAATVVGWHAPREALFLPGESRTRDAFLQYLDTIRLKPRGINLHSDSWWTLPLPFNERDVLTDIEALRKGFYERTGMFFDTYALDLGWSDPRTLWGIDARNFPQGLGTINDRLRELGCRMGMWVSPSSGYPPGLDNTWLDQQGYEMTAVADDEKYACFALGGRYQREFTETIVGYAREYGLRHVIFDGLLNSCDNPAHLHATGPRSAYSIAAGFRDVMNRLRLVNPNMVLEPLSCGSPPSPWWNLHSPYLLGPAGDDVPYGHVPCPDWTESLVSSRDIAYRARQEQWLVRTQALETFDIIVQSPGLFQHMAVMAAGRGRWFMSANIRPELMAPGDWDFLAELVRWQRHNERYLIDARMFGGKPENREAYGYMFHHADKDLYCVRNPWIEPRTIRLPARVRDVRDVQMIYPRRARIARVVPDEDGPTLVLGPYETLFLETIPASGDTPAGLAENPTAAIDAADPIVHPSDTENDASHRTYEWSGAIALPQVTNAELCVLVEGAPGVEAAEGSIWINGEQVAATRKSSAGQFGAAIDASPENWTWFLVPLPVDRSDLRVQLSLPAAANAVGVYARGTVSATSDTAPEGIPAFPVYQPDRRVWSQTLQPLKALGGEPTETDSP